MSGTGTAPGRAAGPSAPVGHARDPQLLTLAVIALAAGAWGVLAVAHPMGHSLGEAAATAPSVPPPGHGHTTGGGAPPAVLVHGALAVGGWAVMVVAMMLPPALPLLQTVRRLVGHRPDPWRLTTLSAMTFVGVWTTVGAVLVAGDLGVRALWAGQGWADARTGTVAGVVLVAAGVYQFTPLKDLCLRGCRSPRSFALAHWQGRRSSGAEIVSLSGAYAASCVGCCWALMLVCFAVGVAALPVMVVLAVLMSAERLVPWGRLLVRPAGLVLVLLGAALVLQLLPPS